MVALVRLRDSIVRCRGCSAENFYDADRLRESGGTSPTCWSCQNSLVLPFRIRIGQRVLLLGPDAKLFPHHVDPQRTWDFSTPVADLSTDPRDPKRVGLRNLSATKWTFTGPGNTATDVPPGRSFPIADGTKVNFGPSEGEIRS